MTDELERIRTVYDARAAGLAPGTYSVLRPGELHMLQRREEVALRLLRRIAGLDLGTSDILDVGCGRGLRLLDWLRWGASPERLAGIDLMADKAEAARRLLPSARIATGSADTLPFPDAHFDIVTQAMTISSILDPAMRRRVAAEMMRVLRPGGAILWYDMRMGNPRNPNTRPVGRRELADLFPGATMEIASLTLAPPLARRLAPLSFTLCRLTEALVPPLRSHLAALIRRPS
jgi:SAM-dependent methyltransferase